jgi:hypothetical protein
MVKLFYLGYPLHIPGVYSGYIMVIFNKLYYLCIIYFTILVVSSIIPYISSFAAI